MIVLVKLLISHILGDFILQPRSWVREKEQKKLRSPKLYLHVLIHFLLLTILLWDLSLWPMVLIIGGSHLIVDSLKVLFQSNSRRRLFFFIDQALHISVILLTWNYFIAETSIIDELNSLNFWALLTCLIFLTKPASIIMQVIFSKWKIDKLTKGDESLEDAGKYIGILERVLVFIFIVMGRWEAVGFLITAKSVFRFGDLKEAKQRKLTEYVLIGTLISFGIAILTALLYINFIK
ncbi:MAG: DUF3307 domain-containing protein [Flavobacteriaceae bacterium]|nr:DUF3307 domain-containing protein [Flavobacteriaceae bacterium]